MKSLVTLLITLLILPTVYAEKPKKKMSRIQAARKAQVERMKMEEEAEKFHEEK